MPALDELQRSAQFLVGREYDITLALAALGEGDEVPTLRSLNIHQRVANSFRGVIAESIGRYDRLRQNGDLSLIEYSGDYDPRAHEIEYIELADDDPVSQLLRSIPSPGAVPLIGDLSDFMRSVRFYVVFASRGNRRVVLFRRFSQNRELQMSKNPIIARYGERYDSLRQPTLQFDTDFDAYLYRGHVFVLKKNNFQHIFRYYEMLRRAAQASLNAIQANVPIENFEEFSASCMGHLQKLSKLRSIAQKGYLRTITIAELRAIINEFELTVQIVEMDGEERLVFDSGDRWAILHLLDDAYLNSGMTGLKYEASAKREV